MDNSNIKIDILSVKKNYIRIQENFFPSGFLNSWLPSDKPYDFSMP